MKTVQFRHDSVRHKKGWAKCLSFFVCMKLEEMNRLIIIGSDWVNRLELL